MAQHEASVRVRVLVDDGERRRRDLRRLRPTPLGEAAREAGLARAEVSPRGRRRRVRREWIPSFFPARSVSGAERDTISSVPFAFRRCPRREMTARARGSASGELRSRAAPRRPGGGPAARPPRRGDTRPPTRRRERAPRGRERAPTMPERTSPEPGVASSGVPVGFTTVGPAGEAVQRALPFRSATHRPARARRPAAPSRSAWTSRVERDRSRPISPGCGVRRTVGAPRLTNAAGSPANAFKASASSTAGIRTFRAADSASRVSSVAAEAGPEHRRVEVRQRPRERLSGRGGDRAVLLGELLRHRLRKRRGDGRLDGANRKDRHETRSGAQRSPGGEHRGARLAGRARHDGEPSEVSLVGVGGAGRQDSPDVRGLGDPEPGAGAARLQDLPGMPMSRTTTRPQSARAGGRTWQSFGAANATVRAARTAGPGTAPPSADNPDGRSAGRRRGTPDAPRAATARAARPVRPRESPVPKSASIAPSAPSSSCESRRSAPGAESGRTSIPRSSARPKFTAASPR